MSEQLHREAPTEPAQAGSVQHPVLPPLGLGGYEEVVAERRMPMPVDHFIALSKAITAEFGDNLLVRQRGEYCQWVRRQNADIRHGAGKES